MSILTYFSKENRTKRIIKKLHRRNVSLSAFDKWMDMQSAGVQSVSGVTVNQNTSLTYSAWFCGVLQLSQTVASLPLVLYKKEGEAKRKYIENPLFNVLAHNVSPLMLSYTWKEACMMALINWGNAYSYIQRDQGRRITGLLLLDPSRMHVEIKNKEKIYIFRRANGKKIEFNQSEILHLVGLTDDGITGKSILTTAARTIGVGIAEEEFKAAFYRQGTNIGGIIKHPDLLSEEAHKRITNTIAKKYASLENSHKIMVLEEGMTFEKMGMPLKDAQFLEGQNFSVQNIARFLNMPPHKLKDQSRSTFNNIESEQASWWQDSIRPWVIRCEQGINNQLIPEAEKNNVFAEFMFDSILRADIETRYKAYSIGLQNGFMNRNQVRKKENWDPIEGDGGDVYTVQLNLIDVNDLKTISDPNNMHSSDTGAIEEDRAFDEKAKRSKVYNSLSRVQKRSLAVRRRITKKWKPSFLGAFQRIYNFEKKEILKLAELELRNIKTFQDKVKEFYEESRNKFETLLKTIVAPYSRAVAQEVQNEVGNEVSNTQEIDIKESTEKFVSNAIYAYSQEGRKKINSLIAKNEDIPLETIQKQFLYWDNTRAEKYANKNSIAAENSTAKHIFFAMNLPLRWVTVGDNCPYCDAMDGKIIRSGQVFFQKGESLSPEGAANSLLINSNISHPPLHGGCDCSITGGL